VYEAQQAAIQQIVEKNPELKADELIIEKAAPKEPTKGNIYYAGNRPQIANPRHRRPNHVNAAVAAPRGDRNDVGANRREPPPIQAQNAHIPAVTANNNEHPFHVHMDRLRRFVNDGYHGRPNIAPNIPNPYVPRQPVHAFRDPQEFSQSVQERIRRAQESRNTRPPPTRNPRAQEMNRPERCIDPFPTARTSRRQTQQGNMNSIRHNNETVGRPNSRRT
ncbi:hypothetical protein BKA69DRAFT_1129536, partial [Paraphysoderma sedebokerense]